LAQKDKLLLDKIESESVNAQGKSYNFNYMITKTLHHLYIIFQLRVMVEASSVVVVSFLVN